MISLCLAVGLGVLIIYFFFYKKSIKEKLKNKGNSHKDVSKKKTKKIKAKNKTVLDASNGQVSVAPPSSPSSNGKIIFEGTDVIVMRPQKCCDNDYSTLQTQEYYTDYEKSYSNTTTQYPKESIRFDLLTPIPYSDAFAAPMGPQPDKNKYPEDYLSQISYTPTFKI